MSTTLISPTIVKVEPDVLETNDVLELAEAIIEEHGHVIGSAGSSDTRGYTIHDAIGEAAKRATGEDGKDGPRSRDFRDEAATRIADQTGVSEFVANDNTDKAGALAILRTARGA